MDEISVDGTTTPDKASGFALTLTNMTSEDFVPGQRGKCATFDGASKILTLDTDPVLTPGLPMAANPQFTVAMWVKGLGSTQTDRRFFSEASINANQPLLNLGTDSTASPNGTARMDLYIRTDANVVSANHLKTVGLPLDDAWHHVAMSDDNGVVRLYVDGNLDSTTVTYTRTALTTTTLSFGGIRRLSGTVAYFNGQVDEAAVWSRILSATEVRSLIANGISIDRTPPYLQGDRLVLKARAILSSPAPAYQWRRNGSNVPGETKDTLIIPAIGPGSDGNYEVVINGTETSAALALSYTPDPAVAVGKNIVSWWPGETLDTGASPATTPDPWGGHPLSCTDMDNANLVPGKFGKALAFDGITEIGYRTTGFPIAGNPEYSVSLWVKADGTTQTDLRFFAEGSDATNTPLFGLGTALDGSARLRAFLRSDGGTALVNVNSESNVMNDEWHHIVWTDRNGQVRLYVDGLLDGSNMNYNRTGQTFTLNQTSLGAIQRAAVSHWYNGLVDDVAVWNRALTWTEVQSLKTAGVPAPVAAVPPKVTLQPKPRSLYAGRSASFSIQATGTAPLQYQWLKGGNPIMDATSFEYTIPVTATGDSGSYTCRVTNSAGTDTSEAVTLTVLPITSLSSGLLSCYPLDSGSPETVDTVGGQNMTLFNLDETTAWQPGVIGQGVFLDGTDDILIHARTGTGTDVPLTNREEFTVAFWVNALGTGQLDRRVFAEASTSNNNPLFNIGTDNTGATDLLDFFFRGDSGTVAVNHLKSTLPVFDGTWHHVTYTDYNGQGQLYVDGVPDLTLSYTRLLSTLTNVSIGGIARAANSHWFAGGVDQLCTWSRALTPEESLLLYQLTSGQTLSVTAVETIPGNRLRLTVKTQLGQRPYRIESNTLLSTGPWAPVENAVISTVTNGVFTAELPLPTAAPRVLYRAAAPW